MSTTPALLDPGPEFDRRSVARVATARPARYGKQLAAHMSRKIAASWDADADTGRLVFARGGPAAGVVELACEEGALVMTLTATAAELERLERVVGIHLARFGQRDGLAVAWTRDDGAAGTVQGPLSAQDVERMRREHEARRAAGH